MLKNNYDGINQSQKQYFPDNSSRNNIDITSGNKSSKSFNHSPNYRKLNSQASRGITVNSSRRTLKSYQSELEKQIERLNSEIDEKDREFCRKNAKKTDEKIKEVISNLLRVKSFNYIE